jgi:hypothetical protein
MNSLPLHRMQPPHDPRSPDLLRELSSIALLVLLAFFVVLI